MSVNARVDPFRVAVDTHYAASLTAAQLRDLARDPVWLDLVADEPELAAIVNNRISRAQARRTGSARAARRQDTEFNVVGKSHRRIHGIGVVSASGYYLENLPPAPNEVHMKLLRSPHPHAKVLSIDTSAAEALPGVVGVLHRFNLPEQYADSTIGGGPPNRYLFSEEVFQVGTPVVAVAAIQDHIADEALRLIQVDYEVLPAVLNFRDGASASTPKQWESDFDGTIIGIPRPFVRGEGATALDAAEVVVESVTRTGFHQHAALELSGILTYWDNDELIHYRTTRHPHGDRRGLAQILKIPQNRVRVIQQGYMGASYGNLRSVDVEEGISAVLAKVLSRPIRYLATRYEDFIFRTGRSEQETTSRLGLNRDGTFVAGHFTTLGNTGAVRSGKVTGGWIGFQRSYKFPNLELDGTDVLTNSFRNGTLRCVSHPTATLAQEVAVDKAAYAIGMDPVALRLLNINEAGDVDNGTPYSNPGLRECIERAAAEIGWSQKWHAPRANEVSPGVFHGIGFAIHTCSHGAGGHPSTGSVIVNNDGTIDVVSAATEVGAGERTTMAMIAAEALGVPLEWVGIAVGVDSATTSDTGVTAGSRQTLSGGWGVYEAAIDAKNQILAGAAAAFIEAAAEEDPPRTIEVTPDMLDIKDGLVYFVEDPAVTMEVGDAVNAVVPNTPVIGRGAHFHEGTWDRIAFAAHAAEVEVDTVTGSVKLLKYVAAHDVGRAINPLGTTQQIEGGAIMGIGAALTEELKVDFATGLPLNGNLLDYKVLSIKDLPRNIDVILVEHPKDYGVFGAHGIGEPPIALAPPTIANAVYNAVGAWVEDMPITRNKVLAALKGVA
ncbi:MAG: xanthine dehydrogenase family protein molybdopterin-binding subunit [Anaerolineales bacterium]|nr:xanthine dehydrogenase family protein molybdopterin-binding subunit [Anaerolineales bacterium]